MILVASTLAWATKVPDSGLVWSEQAVRYPVDPGAVTPAPPFVPERTPEVLDAVWVEPGRGAAFFLDGLEMARVRVLKGSGVPRIQRVFGGSRSSIQTGLEATIETPTLRDPDGSWRIMEPAGDGDVWVVDADAPIRVRIEHPRTLPARLAWEDARHDVLRAIDRGGEAPRLPGEDGATEVSAAIAARVAIGEDLVQGAGQALRPAVAAWEKAAALRDLDGIRPFAWPYWSVDDLGDQIEGDRERILRVDGDVASRASWRRVDGSEPLTFEVRGPGILRVQTRAVLQPGWLVAPSATHVEVARDGVVASAITYTGRPARVTDRADEAFPVREVLVTRDGQWAGKINEIRIPLAPGRHTYTVDIDQLALVRVSRAERRPFASEALFGRASAEDWVRAGRAALERASGPHAALLRALIADVQGEGPPEQVTGLPPALQALGDTLAAAHGQTSAQDHVGQWTAALSGEAAPPWSWWLRVRMADLLPEGSGVRALFAAATDLPPPGLLAPAAVRLGAPGLYQDRPDRGLGALELAWRALPADRSVRATYLRQFLDSATWSRITPVVIVNGDAVAPTAMTWLDTAAATGGPISRASRVYYRIPGGATRTYVVSTSPADASAPAAFSVFVRSPLETGLVSIGIDQRAFRAAPLTDIERLDFAVPPGPHQLSLTAPAGTDAWVSGVPEREEWRQPQDIATVRSYWPTSIQGAVPRFEIPSPQVPVPIRVELRALDPERHARAITAHIRTDTGADWPVTLVPGTGDPTLLPIGGEAPLSSVATITVQPPSGTSQLWVDAPADAGWVVSMSVRRTEVEDGPPAPPTAAGSLDELADLGRRLLADPRDGAALLRRADVLAQLGDTDMARQDLRRLLRLGDSARVKVGDDAIDRVSDRIDSTDTSGWYAPVAALAGVTEAIPLSAELLVVDDEPQLDRLLSVVHRARAAGPTAALSEVAGLDPARPSTSWLRGRLLHALDRDVEAAESLVGAWEASGDWQYGLQATGWLAATEVAAGPAPAGGSGSVGYGLAAELRQRLEHPAVERLALLAGRRTRWDSVRSADQSAGRVLVSSDQGPTPPLPQSRIREALTVAPWPAAEAQFVTAKEPAALTVATGRPIAASVWCQPLRAPESSGEASCTAVLSVDGVNAVQKVVPAYSRAEIESPPLPPGRHDVLVALDDPSRVSALSVRFREVGPVTGRALVGRRDTPGFVAMSDQPFQLSAAGPATVFLELRSLEATGGIADVRVRSAGTSLPVRSVVLPTTPESGVQVSGSTNPVGAAQTMNVVLPTAGVWTITVAPRDQSAVLVRAALRQEMGAPTVQRPGPMWRAIAAASEPFDWPSVTPDPAPLDAGRDPHAWHAGTFSLNTSFGRSDLDQESAAVAPSDTIEVSAAWRSQVVDRRLWVHLEPAYRTFQAARSYGLMAEALYRILGPDVRFLMTGQVFTQVADGARAAGFSGGLRAYRPTRIGKAGFLIPSVEARFSGTSLTAPPVGPVDPDVFDPFTLAHPFGLRPQLMYWGMPAQDLVWYVSANALTNADLASLDRVAASAVARTLVHPSRVPVWLEARYRPTYRLPDTDRTVGFIRQAVGGGIGTYIRLGEPAGLWFALSDDVYVTRGRPLENLLGFDARFDLSGGRALRDRLPVEEDFFDLLAGDRWGSLDEDIP